MKANEAPEKVYLLFNRPYLVDYTKLNKRRCEEEVEYSRTDAFIKKAERYIRSIADGLDSDDDVEAFISGFIKAMKGE